MAANSNPPRSSPTRPSQPWSHPTIKNSLIGRTTNSRDNTVICGVGTRLTYGNQPSVARLPRRQTSTKAELSARPGLETHRLPAELPMTIVVNADARLAIPVELPGLAFGSSEHLSLTHATQPHGRPSV